MEPRKEIDITKLPDFTVVKYDPAAHDAALLNLLDNFKDEYGHLLTVMATGGAATGTGLGVSLVVGYMFSTLFWPVVLVVGGTYLFREEFGWSKSWEDFYQARDQLEKIFLDLNKSNYANLTFDPVYLKIFETIASFKTPAEVEALIPRYKVLSPKFVEIVRGHLPGYKPNELEQQFLAFNASDDVNLTENTKYLDVFRAVLISIKDDEIGNYIPKDKPLSRGFLDMVRARLPKYEPPKDQPKKESSFFGSGAKVSRSLVAASASTPPTPKEEKQGKGLQEHKEQAAAPSKELPGFVNKGLAVAKVEVFKKRQTAVSFLKARLPQTDAKAEAARLAQAATGPTLKLASK
ncbi:MAG TPA: hypothetical protein VLH77_06860, partial [Gammaproteobacteria bacterium]|nr:hypothetical protein [Gammaproteobacteria bacterium]